jgi:hypothetical protein|tara:strand:- start:341 stop:541 length:201 start_codon:yes stop_codon:yes gene_type:complete
MLVRNNNLNYEVKLMNSFKEYCENNEYRLVSDKPERYTDGEKIYTFETIYYEYLSTLEEYENFLGC